MSVPIGLQPPRRVEFRRPTRALRRRRRSPWLVFLRRMGKVLVMIGVPLAAATWLFTAPRFQLAHLEIETGTRVPQPWAETTLLPLLGTNLFALSLDEADGRLNQHPWLDEARLRKQLPNTLVVEIDEKVPVAVAAWGDRKLFVDDRGETIGEVVHGQGEEYLRIECEELDPATFRNALVVAESLTRARLQWGLSLQQIEVLGREDFRVRTSVLPFPLVVRPSTIELGVAHLAQVLEGLEREIGLPESADLRYPHRIVLKRSADSNPGVAPSVDT